MRAAIHLPISQISIAALSTIDEQVLATLFIEISYFDEFLFLLKFNIWIVFIVKTNRILDVEYLSSKWHLIGFVGSVLTMPLLSLSRLARIAFEVSSSQVVQARNAASGPEVYGAALATAPTIWGT